MNRSMSKLVRRLYEEARGAAGVEESIRRAAERSGVPPSEVRAALGFEPKTFAGPKSLCACGHTGDGEMSCHAGLIGHGMCLSPACGCAKFTWVGWTPEFERFSVKEHVAKG